LTIRGVFVKVAYSLELSGGFEAILSAISLVALLTGTILAWQIALRPADFILF